MRKTVGRAARGAACAISLITLGAGLAACGRDASAPRPSTQEEPSGAELGLAGQPGPRDSALKSMPGTHPPDAGKVAPGGGAPPGVKSLSCAEVAGRWDCIIVREDGLTIAQSTAFLDAAGTPSPRPTPTTVAQSNRMSVKGTTTETFKLDNGTTVSVTRTIDESGDHTVSGMQPGSTARVVNGWRKGSSSHAKTADRSVKTTIVYADTTRGLTHPVVKREPPPPGQKEQPVFPTAGTVIRHSTTTIAADGKTPETIVLREQISYDGTSVAKVVVTRNGVTKSCTRDLLTGKQLCE